MPGKVNPTQSEAVTMVCVKVKANDITMAGSWTFGATFLNH